MSRRRHVINMCKTIIEFLRYNWINLALIIVGSLALVIYVLQERRKVTEAASLIVLQIDEIQDRIKEIQSYIVDGQLNNTAFYESQILLEEDYWKRSKHYFVKRMDSKSFRTINNLYDCAAEIRDQQQLMKSLQKNHFYIIQKTLSDLETNYIANGLKNKDDVPKILHQVTDAIVKTMPQDLELAQKEAVEKFIHMGTDSNGNTDFSLFWKDYNKNRNNIINVINQNALTSYIPLQIRSSIEKAINQYVLLEVTGCDGYRMLKKVAKRKF